MYGFTTQLVLAIACTPIAAVAGCQSAADPSPVQNASPSASQAAQQLILKFKSLVPFRLTCDSTGIGRLGAATHVALKFIRPMSGDACVVQQAAPSPNELERGFARLKQHPAVEWVEIDAVMKAL